MLQDPHLPLGLGNGVAMGSGGAHTLVMPLQGVNGLAFPDRGRYPRLLCCALSGRNSIGAFSLWAVTLVVVLCTFRAIPLDFGIPSSVFDIQK